MPGLINSPIDDLGEHGVCAEVRYVEFDNAAI